MSLGAELASKGIDVQAQTPLYVTTKMAKIRKSSLTAPGLFSFRCLNGFCLLAVFSGFFKYTTLLEAAFRCFTVVFF